MVIIKVSCGVDGFVYVHMQGGVVVSKVSFGGGVVVLRVSCLVIWLCLR